MEIVVVDDCSIDNSLSIASQFGVAILSFPYKLNAGGARAKGYLASSGDLVAFVDSDIVLDPSWMKVAADLLSNDASLGAVGGAVCPPSSRCIAEWADYLASFSAYSETMAAGQRVFLPTNQVMIKRQALASVDFLDTYGDEDIDLCYRLSDQGYKLLFDPRLRAIHLGWRKSYIELVKTQERYATGLLKSSERFMPSKGLLRLPTLLYIPTFITLKMTQIVSRIWKSPYHLFMYLLSCPVLFVILLARAYWITTRKSRSCDSSLGGR